MDSIGNPGIAGPGGTVVVVVVLVVVVVDIVVSVTVAVTDVVQVTVDGGSGESLMMWPMSPTAHPSSAPSI